jgi:hypothetical protein
MLHYTYNNTLPIKLSEEEEDDDDDDLDDHKADY